MNLACERINQESKLCAIGNVFGHLCTELQQGVAARAKLNDKVRTDWSERLFALATVQRVPFFFRNPRSIGRTNGPIWQREACGRAEYQTSAVTFGPCLKLV